MVDTTEKIESSELVTNRDRSQKTFDGKKPYSFLKSQITYALRPKITYAGKAVKLHKQTLNETITAVRSVNYVPDKIY